MWRSTALEREGQAELFLFERAIHVGIGEDEQCTYNAAGPRFLNVFFLATILSHREDLLP
jgi:hypothetical protein